MTCKLICQGQHLTNQRFGGSLWKSTLSLFLPPDSYLPSNISLGCPPLPSLSLQVSPVSFTHCSILVPATSIIYIYTCPPKSQISHAVFLATAYCIYINHNQCPTLQSDPEMAPCSGPSAPLDEDSIDAYDLYMVTNLKKSWGKSYLLPEILSTPQHHTQQIGLN